MIAGRQINKVEGGIPIGLILVLISSFMFAVVWGFVNVLKFRIFSTTIFGWQWFYSYLKIADGKNLFDMYVLPEYSLVAYLFIPINYLLAFVYKLFPRPEFLLILQSAVIASGALPVYLIAKKHIKSTLIPLALAISYLLHPVVTVGSMLGYIPVCFGLPFILYAIYYLEKENLGGFVIFIFLACMTKIDAAIMILVLGIILFFFRKRRKYAVAALSISIVWLIFMLMSCNVLLKMVHKPFPAPILHFDKYGNRLIDAMRYSFNNPGQILKNFFNMNNSLVYLFFVIPNIFCFIKPLYLLPVIPETVLILIRNQHSSGLFLILPFIFTAAIKGLRTTINIIELRIINNANSNIVWQRLNILVAATLLFPAVLLHYYVEPKTDWLAQLGPIPFTRYFNLRYYNVTSHVKIGYKFLSMIPSNASCFADNSLAAHLGRINYLGRIDKFSAEEKYAWDYIFVDLHKKDLYQIDRLDYLFMLEDFLTVRGYGVMAFEDGWLLLKKGYRQDQNADLLVLLDKAMKEKP